MVAMLLFLWGKFSPLHNAKNPLQLIQRISREKKAPKLPHFQGIFFSEITIFRQQVPACSQNMLGFLKQFYLHFEL
jgi:hypothetical protein